MTTIRVPAPPANAFHKERPVSDLLRGQLKHFQHIESRLPLELQSGMQPRDYVTEEGAARYIAHLTNALQSSAAAPVPRKRRAPIRFPAPPSVPISIAAAAAPAAAVPSKPAKKAKSQTSPRGKKKP